MPALDYLGRPLSVGDYVFYYSNLYQVLEVRASSMIRCILVEKSPSTKSRHLTSKATCRVDREDVLVWKLKDSK